MFKPNFVSVALCTLAICSSTMLAHAEVGADNSRINKQAEANGEANAQSQSNSKSDIELTRRIRRSVVKNKSLSVDAKNIKIITSGGTVLLKGPVKSQREKNRLKKIAAGIAGSNHITDEIEIE